MWKICAKVGWKELNFLSRFTVDTHVVCLIACALYFRSSFRVFSFNNPFTLLLWLVPGWNTSWVIWCMDGWWLPPSSIPEMIASATFYHNLLIATRNHAYEVSKYLNLKQHHLSSDLSIECIERFVDVSWQRLSLFQNKTRYAPFGLIGIWCSVFCCYPPWTMLILFGLHYWCVYRDRHATRSGGSRVVCKSCLINLSASFLVGIQTIDGVMLIINRKISAFSPKVCIVYSI